MKLVITGLSGYIGERLAAHALGCGHVVVAASRRLPVVSSYSWIQYELDSRAPVELPRGTTAVIHLAANTSSVLVGMDDEYEVSAARALIAASQQSKAKLVFVSSQTARSDAPTVYGRTKWRIEQDVLAAGGWVVRPGQVYGGIERGLFGAMVGTVRRLPILPAFLPTPKVQPIHVDDLVEGLLRIVERDDVPSGVLCLASPQPVPFAQFLLSIAENRVRRQRLLAPVPSPLIKLMGACLPPRLKSRFGIEKLNSLFGLPVMDTASDLQRLGLSLRPLHSGMHPSGDDRRRRLIAEGKALLIYVLKVYPGSALVRRYVRAIEQLREGKPLNLPAWVLRRPVTVALLDDRAFAATIKGAELIWRVHAATALAEASVQGAGRFLGVGQSVGVFVNSFAICKAVTAEIFWRLLQLVCFPFLKGIMRENGELR